MKCSVRGFPLLTQSRRPGPGQRSCTSVDSSPSGVPIRRSAQCKPDRGNDLGDHDRYHHGNNRLPENTQPQPLLVPCARGSCALPEVRSRSPYQRCVVDDRCRVAFLASGSFLRGAAIKPSRCACFRLSLRIRRIPSPFSRANLSEGFS